MAERPQVTVSPDSSHEKPWRMDCDLCPDTEPLRFYSRHWGVAAADEHARTCPNAPEE